MEDVGASDEHVIDERVDAEGEVPLAVYIVIAFFVSLVFLTLGGVGGPRLVSIVAWGLLVVYILVVTSKDYEMYSWIVALALLTLHVGAVLSYYSHPEILPFFIIERDIKDGVVVHESVNFDFVQLVILAEIIRYLISRKRYKSPAGYETSLDSGGEEAAVV
ncbi:MAG: hypothetical protein F7C35_02730 [Desulfurococcales archaeon]|nr:hypothetical protein [Desulfurococcales archaeon]